MSEQDNDADFRRAIVEFIHVLPKDVCEHEWAGWREFEDGRGGEQVCAKCGMGGMHHSLIHGDD